MLEKQQFAAVRLYVGEFLCVKFQPKHRAGGKGAKINLA